MYTLYLERHFSAAHRLREYDGNCEQLHGHNWKVDLQVSSAILDNLGMVIDFRVLKKLAGEVLDELDHHYLNEVGYFKTINPSTENIARFIYEKLSVKLPEGVHLDKVTAWESPGAGASYTKQEQEDQR